MGAVIGRQPLAASRRFAVAVEQRIRRPHTDQEDHHRKRKVRRQPVLAHVDALGQAAHHHEPAERGLRDGECPDRHEARHEPMRHPLSKRKKEERNREHKAAHARQQPVHVLPKVDALELREGHTGIHLHVLRDLLIFLKLGDPTLVTDGWDHAAEWLPFRDRKAALGEARAAADEDDSEDHRRPDGEPLADTAGVVCRCDERSSGHGEISGWLWRTRSDDASPQQGAVGHGYRGRRSLWRFA